MTGVRVSYACLRRTVCFRTRVEQAQPTNLMRADAFGCSCHAFGAEVGGVGKSTRQHGWNTAWRFAGAHMGKMLGKTGPVVNLF